LGPLPEFPVVGAREKGFVFLRFVLEDRDALALHLIRRQGYGHLDLIDAPFLPRAAIEPDLALLHPVPVAQSPAGFEYRRQADAMSAVRVGQVAGGVNLVWLDA